LERVRGHYRARDFLPPRRQRNAKEDAKEFFQEEELLTLGSWRLRRLGGSILEHVPTAHT